MRDSLVHNGLCGSYHFRSCIVSEFCELGELYGFLHRLRRPLHHSMVVSMSIDCALGLNYLHTRDPPIIWRDCKTKNYLVSEIFRSLEHFLNTLFFFLSL